jgi:hypothetical protein
MHRVFRIALLLPFAVAAVGCNTEDAVVGSGAGASGQGAGSSSASNAGGAGGDGANGGGAGAGASGGGGVAGPEWTQGWGNSVRAIALDVDADDNVVLTGHFDAVAPICGTDTLPDSPQDIFLAKLDGSGGCVATAHYGGEYLAVWDLAVTGQTSVLVGSYVGTPSFGGELPVGDYYPDGYVAAFSAPNALLWAQPIAGSGTQEPWGVATDASGTVYLTGSFDGSIAVADGPTHATANDTLDIFVAKLAADGSHDWSVSFGDGGVYQEGRAIAADSAGNAIAVGHFDDTLVLSTSITLTAKSPQDMFIAKFDTTGTPMWAIAVGETGSMYPAAVAVDASDNIIVTGDWYGVIDFGDGIVSATGTDGFVAKYDPGGGLVWKRTFGGESSQGARSVAIDASGGIYLTGYFYGSVDFGNGPLDDQSRCTRDDPCYDGFLVKYAPDGNALWSRRWGAAGNDVGFDLAKDSAGATFLTGWYSDTVDFGDAMPLAGEYDDLFLLKFPPD